MYIDSRMSDADIGNLMALRQQLYQPAQNPMQAQAPGSPGARAPRAPGQPAQNPLEGMQDPAAISASLAPLMGGPMGAAAGTAAATQAPTHTMTIQNGLEATTAPFNAFGQSAGQPTTQPALPPGARLGQLTGSEFGQMLNAGTLGDPSRVNLADLTRYLTVGNGQVGTGNGPEGMQNRLQAMQAFLQMQHGSLGQQAETRQGQGQLGDLFLRAQNQQGQLALGQDQESRLRAQMQMQFGRDAQIGALRNQMMMQPGATGDSVADTIAGMDRRHLFDSPNTNMPGQTPISALGGGGWQNPAMGAPASSPLSASLPGQGQPAPAQGNQTPLGGNATPTSRFDRPGAQTGTGPTYGPIEHQLNAVAGIRPGGQGQQAVTSPTGSIGEFLMRLDQSSSPGFVRQNWPAIQAYINRNWDASAVNDATARAGNERQMNPLTGSDFVPLWGLLKRAGTAIRQRVSGPTTEEQGLSALGDLLGLRQQAQRAQPASNPLNARMPGLR